MKEKQYIVAIKCMVYNHEPYLRDCLKGFVMQKTNFPFVAIVHDDASTDKSADIIREYADKYPDIIRPIYETENQYSKHDGSLGRIMNKAVDAIGAKYVAMCEGDDYWTDPLKLQKQVDILEKDETLMACCTNCSVVDRYSNVLKPVRGGVVPNDVEGRYNLRQFFDDNHTYPTLSVVYRNNHSQEVSYKTQIMLNPYLGDWTLWIALLCFGDFYFLNQVTCAYRVNPTSVTHSGVNKRLLGVTIENFSLHPRVANVLPEQYVDIAVRLRDTRWNIIQLAHAYWKNKMYLRSIWYIIASAIKAPHQTIDYFKRFI